MTLATMQSPCAKATSSHDIASAQDHLLKNWIPSRNSQWRRGGEVVLAGTAIGWVWLMFVL